MPSSTTRPSIRHVAAVHLARRQDVDRRLRLLHDAYLHRRCLRAQHHVRLARHGGDLSGEVLDIEGVRRVARRVVRRGVERGEVVVVELAFGTFGHPVADAGEDLDDLARHALDEVLMPRSPAPTRERHVDGLGGQAGFERRCSEHGLALGDGGLQRDTNLVAHLAGRRALLGAQGAKTTQDARE
jgi:hypothetical protein